MANLRLLTTKGQIHKIGGLNWGSNIKNHTTPFDAYIPIHLDTLKANTNLFPPKSITQKVLKFTWDDTVVMQVIFEGTQMLNGLTYPKQISSYPSKRSLGIYFRKRLGVSSTHIITLQDLINYGRNDINLIKISDTEYQADFHV